MKSKDITKYEALWQIVRSSVKGSRILLEDKLIKVREYFNETKTFDRWERCYNWLEGLERGYRACSNFHAIHLIKLEKAQYTLDKPDKSTRFNTDDWEELMKADEKAIKLLWNDLFKSNINWLNGGYFHKERNEFVDKLLIFILERGIQIKPNQLQTLQEKRAESFTKINKHKFLFA